jgi:hypothetical protein
MKDFDLSLANGSEQGAAMNDFARYGHMCMHRSINSFSQNVRCRFDMLLPSHYSVALATNLIGVMVSSRA